MNAHQDTFDSLLDSYNAGNEPLENWRTEDLIKLLDAIDRELQNRNQEPAQFQIEDDPLEEWYRDMSAPADAEDPDYDDYDRYPL